MNKRKLMADVFAENHTIVYKLIEAFEAYKEVERIFVDAYMEKCNVEILCESHGEKVYSDMLSDRFYPLLERERDKVICGTITIDEVKAMPVADEVDWPEGWQGGDVFVHFTKEAKEAFINDYPECSRGFFMLRKPKYKNDDGTECKEATIVTRIIVDEDGL